MFIRADCMTNLQWGDQPLSQSFQTSFKVGKWRVVYKTVANHLQIWEAKLQR